MSRAAVASSRFSKLTLLAIASALLASTVVDAQRLSDLKLTSPTAVNPSIGTVALVLANRNGFVIATDSRQSRGNTHFDNSQKLYKVDSSTALAVTGFAANLEPPFMTTIAGEVYKALPAFDGERVEAWVETAAGRAIRVLRMVAWAEASTANLETTAILASQKHGQSPQIFRWPSNERYEANQFLCVRSGVTDVIDAVLNGGYIGKNPVILRFARGLRANALNEAPIGELTSIAKALVVETSHFYGKVGGPVQLGVFEDGRLRDWVQQPFDPDPPAFGRIVHFDHDTNCFPPPTPQAGNSGGDVTMQNSICMGTGQVTVDSPTVTAAVPGMVVTFVTNSLLDRRIVVLDGNVFVANWFSNCILRIDSRMPTYWRKNRCSASFLVVSSSKSAIPLDANCEPVINVNGKQ